MPFLLYGRQRSAEGAGEFVQLREVSLAGTTEGLIHPFVAKYAPAASTFPWHATAGDLLAEAGIRARGHAVVVALKPTVKGNLSLLELTDVWGYSYAEWTPLALRLETLFVDRSVADPARFQQRFTDEGCGRTPVHEFLYLRGGLRGGAWTWGPVGSVNGVLLRPDALGYFVHKIRERSRAPGPGDATDAEP
ncbi:MAG TPA: hypothetical protein VNE39_04555 [Planctomycetota bacterium]|nr:hypothetical protein [Planctomycetota bacterium]